MTIRLPEAEARRAYADALERALRHAAAHVGRAEAMEIAHHVASAVVRRMAREQDPATAESRDPVTSIDAFIHRSVGNRLRDLWRANRKRQVAEHQYYHERCAVAPAWTEPGANLESRELHRLLEGVVTAMPEGMREVFLLVRRDERSYKEVADQLGVGVGTVHTQLSRASALLRQALADYRAGESTMNGAGRGRAAGGML